MDRYVPASACIAPARRLVKELFPTLGRPTKKYRKKFSSRLVDFSPMNRTFDKHANNEIPTKPHRKSVLDTAKAGSPHGPKVFIIVFLALLGHLKSMFLKEGGSSNRRGFNDGSRLCCDKQMCGPHGGQRNNLDADATCRVTEIIVDSNGSRIFRSSFFLVCEIKVLNQH